jgi:hypothetical protein
MEQAACPHVSEVDLQNLDGRLEKVKQRFPNIACTAASCSFQFPHLYICLTRNCESLGCGRAQGAHALRHSTTIGHPLSLNLSTRAIWCYRCGVEITDEHPDTQKVDEIRALLNFNPRRSRGPAQRGTLLVFVFSAFLLSCLYSHACVRCAHMNQHIIAAPSPSSACCFHRWMCPFTFLLFSLLFLTARRVASRHCRSRQLRQHVLSQCVVTGACRMPCVRRVHQQLPRVVSKQIKRLLRFIRCIDRANHNQQHVCVDAHTHMHAHTHALMNAEHRLRRKRYCASCEWHAQCFVDGINTMRRS